MLEAGLMVCIGALAAVMANLGIAVFNDGLRPIVPENLEGRMSRKELGVTAFAMSFGLVIGFGIPISIAGSIILIHSILLGTDIIGLAFNRSKVNAVLAGVAGALYGLGIYYGLQSVVEVFKMLPLNFVDGFNKVGEPVVVSFMVFPAIAVALQFSIKKGVLTFIAAAIARQLIVFANTEKLISINGTQVVLSPEGIALIIGMVFLLSFAMREKSEDQNLSILASLFTERVAKIRKYSWVLMISGALVAVATHQLMIAGDPISLNLLSDGKISEGGIASLAKAIGFVPLIASTAIATGVYGPVGFTFVFGAGIFSPNPFLAAILGAVIIFAEVMLLTQLAKVLDRYPGIRESGENIRTAMTRVLEVALLIGGANAANAIVPGLGFFAIAGLYLLNEAAGRPIVRMAVGPIGAIAVGILGNILVWIGLYTPPAG
ncbi:YhfT family protein [Fictibacillus enclensis]|uniref:YhfT family protein n=1 Tax=Fictibacillus enclensis TaxID=1017270 RepID=UPI0025A23872|nr:YhfT family protein [Fictibacillus enclensis]MDM5338587.1 YhfT family protein [Fictibacillus enclensis]